MTKTDEKLKIALVHDHLTTFGGAERVLYAMHRVFPEAPIYTLFSDEDITGSYFPNADIRVSSLQKFPKFLRKRFRYLSPFAIPAIENFDLRDFDIVISSAAFFAKGVITDPEAVHISYCHTPTRYLWDYESSGMEINSKNIFIRFLEKLVLHFFRLWDYSAAERVDYFIANSKNTKKRIQKIYNKDAFIVYPSVDIELIQGENADPLHRKSVLDNLPDNFFLIVSQLQKYKNIDLAVETFNKLEYPLVIIGDGPERKYLEKIASDNIIFLGRQPDDIVRECYDRAHAYIYPGKEDFGISAVEAMLFGKPVIAYRGGGLVESVVEGVSGEFFDDAHPAVLADAVRRLNLNYENYNPLMIKNVGSKFGKDRFVSELRRILTRILEHEMKEA
ncbi:MAG: glycosyltransferase [Candidatus Spechtbacterales bacterium]|nr:glycosyltransferase [Candidatus Spechtbacterales bacterium]